jgi:predicted adenylyl cyclase CyaB
MARNIEIKARVTNPEAMRNRAAALSGTLPEIIMQEDTFFHSPRGRLKLRVLSSEPAQLISYDRPGLNGPKLSNYHIYETSDPEILKTILSISLGIRGLVRKERHLYRIGQTRIHLDDVTGLGHFLELEVVLRPDQSEADGEIIARDLMAKLNIREQDLIEGAYIDLLESGPGNIPARDS